MKKILAAGIKQIVQSDSLKEMYVYIGKLRKQKINHKCISHVEQDDGKVLLTIIKAYNDSPLIEN